MSNRISVECKLSVYEVDGDDSYDATDKAEFSVSSHWNRSEMIVLRFGKDTITVDGRGMITAIENAMRTS